MALASGASDALTGALTDAPLLHVVLVRFHDGVPQAQREATRQRMAALGEACGGAAAGILAWRADWNADTRKGWQLMEAGVFADAAALQRFQRHPAHAAFGTELRAIADWVVGDLPDWRLPPAALTLS
ncbi:MAG: hypothetical protein RLY78_3971 [Pseudomonadota bacterium]